MLQEKARIQTTGNQLKIIAMIAMFLDHTFMLFPSALWLKAIGRLALPIFCFLLVEGFHHTKSVHKYAIRLLAFGIIAQVPYMLIISPNELTEGLNILYTLFAALTILCFDHTVRKYKRFEKFHNIIVVAYAIAVQWLLILANVDGCTLVIPFVLAFYWAKDNKGIQFAVVLMASLALAPFPSFPVKLFTSEITMPIQIFATLSLPLIWLYKGKRGRKNKHLQRLFYLFYPAHLFVIVILYIIFQ